MEKLGTFVSGVGSSSALDSSGERLKQSGIDDSSLENDGFFNFEHESKHTSQIVGKVLVSRKISVESDCQNEDQRKWYNKIGKKPYLYICGVLFDGFGHTGATDLAAMYKFNSVMANKDGKTTIGFSIEGSKLDKEGDTITRCIARKITCTLTPCNKECVSEIITDEDYIDGLTAKYTKDKLHDMFLKCEELNMDLMKAEEPKPKLNIPKISSTVDNKPKASKQYMSIPKQTAMGTTGAGVKETRPAKPIETKGKVFTSGDKASSKMKVGDKVLHDRKAKTGVSGASIYNNPNTWKTENKKYGVVLEKKKMKMDKAMTAGGMGGAPSTMVNGSAMQKEQTLVKKSEKLLSKVLKKSESYWNSYNKKDELIEFISLKMPKLGKKEVMAIAKTTVYKMEKEREHLLAGLCE